MSTYAIVSRHKIIGRVGRRHCKIHIICHIYTNIFQTKHPIWIPLIGYSYHLRILRI